MLSFYETSYFFFLKRYYLFNNLKTNQFDSLEGIFMPKTPDNLQTNQHLHKLTTSLKSNALVNSNLELFNDYVLNKGLVSRNSLPLRDIFMMRADTDL
jgi:hypothetical protein